jgi:hypothetical protein
MERAAFLIQDPQQRSTETRLSCLLNPNTLVFRRVAGLRRRRSLTAAVTQDGLRDDLLFETGGGLTELRVDLLFDVNLPGTWLGITSADGGTADADVRDLTRPLWNLAENQRRPGDVAGPPRIRFVWGKRWDFPAVVAAVAERLENFAPSGVPQRSFLRLRLLRAGDDATPEDTGAPASRTPAPEPASPLDVVPAAERAPAGTYDSYRSPGHPMFLTAYLLFGDPARWTAIAEANPDVDPVFVPPGTVLSIPTPEAAT